MDPQKGSLCVPLIKDGPLEEPGGSSILMNTASNIVVFRRIWRTQPIFGVLLYLVTCSPSQRARSTTRVTYNERLILFISLAICCIASIIVVSSCGPFANTVSIPRAFRIPTVDALPSRPRRCSQLYASNKRNKAYHS